MIEVQFDAALKAEMEKRLADLKTAMMERITELQEQLDEAGAAMQRLYAERSTLIEERDAAVREVAKLKMLDGNDRLIEARREAEDAKAKADAWRHAAFGALAVTSPEGLSGVDAQDAYQALAALARTKERVTIVTNVASAGEGVENIEDERDPGCECFELCEHAGFCPARCP